ncbi:MAG: hypothetical protein ACRDBG_19445 [Waterburya sp.]
MSSYTIPTAQTLPTPGATNRHTEETDVRLWLTYWQTYLINLLATANRLTGGIGFDGDNIADKAIKSNHIQLQTDKVGWSGSNNFPVSAGGRYAYHSFPLNLTFDNAVVDFQSLICAVTAGSGTRLFVMIERKAGSNFATAVGGFSSLEGSQFDDLQVRTLQPNQGQAFEVSFRDSDPKPAGIYYYRVHIQSIDASVNALNNVAEWKPKTKYTVINGKYA